jgi:hypothetical protein
MGTTVHLLGANVSYDKGKQVVEKNQIIQMNGYSDDTFVVYEIAGTEQHGFSYKLINLRTKEFRQTDVIRPLSQKFGIGYYVDEENTRFLTGFQVGLLQNEADLLAKREQSEQEEEQKRTEQLTTIGRERLEKLIPTDAKAVIVAELHEDDSDRMTDYFNYRTIKTIILGFSTHTRDLFSEMRKHAVNFEETAHLAEENEKYEHREKYTGGAGYYLGKNVYSGWIIRKVKYYKDRERIIDAFALTAGEEENIRVKEKVQPTSTITPITGDFLIVDYSQKALAVFGDTRSIKERLKELGGKFNSRLTHNEKKQAGWIFQKSKEQEIRDLLNIQCDENL